MKRAYPQYMAAGGEQLPPALLKVLFPVDYWALIRRYSAERHLDPYLMAALIAQESTFEVAVKSSANAYGLMQLLPSTGRRYAKALKMKRFSTGLLTTAETNVSMGTAYFADLMKRFSAPHLALASYNAGEHRVSRWLAERPGVDREEFIDDIPFPETQNYVKRILGTVEDYRRLYAVEPGQAEEEAADATRAAAARAAATSTKASATPVGKKSVTASPKSQPAPARKTKARRPTAPKPTKPA
jgi:soluble lytic murein transglycosylase